jgi:hypothetical protein
MKRLIVEDDFISRLLLQEIMKQFGPALSRRRGAHGNGIG